MKYLLDTNICIYIIKNHPESVIKKFQTLQIGEVGISSITLAELEYGVAKSAHHVKNQNALHNFILPLEIPTFDALAAKVYGQIRASLESQGKLIGPMDMMIAAHAISLDVILVTNNEKEFNRVRNINVENWITKMKVSLI